MLFWSFPILRQELAAQARLRTLPVFSHAAMFLKATLADPFSFSPLVLWYQLEHISVVSVTVSLSKKGPEQTPAQTLQFKPELSALLYLTALSHSVMLLPFHGTKPRMN